MRKTLTILFLLCSALGMALVPPRDPSQFGKWQAERERMQQRNQQTFDKAQAPAAMYDVGTQMIIPRVLVIMANFANYEFISTKADVDSMFNARNWTKDGATGSVRQYYFDQSAGMYEPIFDVVGPITLSHSYGYYGKLGAGSIGHMVTEACAIVDDEVDFTNYDSDGNGSVDLVYVLYAGFGQNDERYIPKELVPVTDSLIWPAYWNVVSAGYGTNKREFDGKKIYACEYSNELDGYLSTADKSVVAGIGVPCHEYCHALGLPDLYATVKGKNHKLLGAWDIMCYGPYNNDAHTPPSLSAYERFFMGWLTPTLITEPDTLMLEHIATSNKAYMIAENDKHNMNGLNPDSTVFYLLENRQLASWDIGIPGSGLMLTRINFQPALWNSNTVNNNPESLGVDLIEADGQTPGTNTADGYWGKATDLFPAGATEYTGIPDHAITDISMNDGIISFVYRGGKKPTDPTSSVLVPADDRRVYKEIRNGQLLIHSNGHTYTAFGAEIYQ